MTRRLVRTIAPQVEEPVEEEKEASSTTSAIDLDEQLEKLKLCLSREVANLTKETISGSLGKDRSTALVNYIKLLNDLKKSQAKDAEKLTDDELEKLARDNETQS